MQKIVIPKTQLSVSRFVFGLARGNTVSARLRLLDAAVDAGFTHFDTAPYYAFGMAERDLRPVLARHRQLTVTTKVGLYSPGGEDQPEWRIIARKALGRAVPKFSRPIADLSVSRARAALEGSMRRLGRDHIDLYLLHEPDVGLLATDEWLTFLEAEVQRGRVGAFGIALNTSRLAGFVAADHPLLSVVQTTDSLAGREADVLINAARPLQLTFGYVGAQARAAPGPVDVDTILDHALARNATGAIVVSTRREDRLAQYAAAVERLAH